MAAVKQTVIEIRPPRAWTVFTDEKGSTYSWARVTCSFMVLCAMMWGSYIVWTKQVIPDFTSFALLVGAVYGVNRLGEAFGTTKPQVSDSMQTGPKGDK